MVYHRSYGQSGPVRPWTWRSYRALQIFIWCTLLLGPLIILNGIRNNKRDRPSFQWPKVPGTIFRSEWRYTGQHHSRRVFVSYSYHVNGQHYVGTRVNLSDPYFNRPMNGDVVGFVSSHPLRSSVDVYYDPLHPENSVLEPGANEARNALLIRVGSIVFVCLIFPVYRASRFLNKVVAWRKANPPKMPARKREKITALPHGFLSYEPASKQKLNCFATRDDLDQFIGHDGKALQHWSPDDRIIDAKGQEYRLVPNARETRYELEPAGETRSWENLLDLAMADAEMLRKDSNALRRRVTDAPAENRLPVLMKCVDEMAMGSRSSCIVASLFLLLFFLAVFFGGMWLFKMLGNWHPFYPTR